MYLYADKIAYFCQIYYFHLMVKSKFYILLLLIISSINISAQDSLQVYMISIKGDTAVHSFSKYSESSSMVFKRKTEQMHFSEETALQLFDNYGNKIKSIKSQHLNLSDVDKGMYYINFYNRKEENWLTVKLFVK